MSKISIVVPVYNPGKKLEKCIKSILMQTFEEFELILVNDGSTDNSLNICNKYKRKDERIVVIDKVNEGSILTRKRGVIESKNEYIMFVDADDWVDKCIVKQLYNEAISTKSDIVICNMYKVIGDAKIVKKENTSKYFESNKVYEGDDIKNEITEAYLHGHPFPAGLVCKLYKKELLISSGKYLERIKFLGDDLYYNLEMFLKAKKIKVIKKSLYYYRVGGFTSKYMPYHFDDIVNGYQIQKEVVDEYYYDTRQKRYNGISIMLLNSFKFSLSNLMRSKLSKLEIKDIIKDYINNENIIEACNNEGSKRYFDKFFLEAIHDKKVDYLYEIGKSINKKSKIKRIFIYILSKLNLL